MLPRHDCIRCNLLRGNLYFVTLCGYFIEMKQKTEGITVVINTYNAQKHLARVLDSVKQFDEIVICDMESTDRTLAIAADYHCKIVTFEKKDFTIVEPARNFAISHASYPWVLVVDADEIVPDALRDYLYSRIHSPHCPDGIYIPRRNYFMGKFMHCYYPDHILRFFKKEGTVWPPIIHVSPIVQGTLFKIPSKRIDLAFEHLANDTVSDIIKKTNDYTRNEVEKKKHKSYGYAAFFYRPFYRFFKLYIIKGGIKDGKEGFIRAVLEGHYHFIVLAKLLEAKKNTQI